MFPTAPATTPMAEKYKGRNLFPAGIRQRAKRAAAITTAAIRKKESLASLEHPEGSPTVLQVSELKHAFQKYHGILSFQMPHCQRFRPLIQPDEDGTAEEKAGKLFPFAIHNPAPLSISGYRTGPGASPPLRPSDPHRRLRSAPGARILLSPHPSFCHFSSLGESAPA